MKLSKRMERAIVHNRLVDKTVILDWINVVKKYEDKIEYYKNIENRRIVSQRQKIAQLEGMVNFLKGK